MRRRAPRLLLAALVALAATACLDPREDETDEAAAPEAPLGSEAPDRSVELLVEELDRLLALLDEAHDHLDAAADAPDLATAVDAAAGAETLLVGGDGDGHDVLFPVETPERGGVGEQEDLLGRTLTAAREVGGSEGRDVTEALRDLVAGDLGGWQRDAEGMLAWVDEVAVPRGSLEETEQAVFELPGGGTHALAYLRLIERADDLERARAYAERGAAHLDVARTLLADLARDAEESA